MVSAFVPTAGWLRLAWLRTMRVKTQLFVTHAENGPFLEFRVAVSLEAVMF